MKLEGYDLVHIVNALRSKAEGDREVAEKCKFAVPDLAETFFRQARREEELADAIEDADALILEIRP